MDLKLIESARRIDAHNHVRSQKGGFDAPSGQLHEEDARASLARADKLGIDLLCVSHPLVAESPKPDEVKLANDVVLQAMQLSARFLGFCYVNPGYARESVREIERCVAQGGMAGIKLYHQYKICDPAQTAVMERAAELGVPVLMHAGKATDTETQAQQPRLSNAAHFVEAAKMFPDTILIYGHIGGGGDWEWSLRVLEERPDIYIDLSGSVVDAGIAHRTIATLGADRCLFATDTSWEEGVGKVLEADLTDAEREKVFAGNFKGILARRKA